MAVENNAPKSETPEVDFENVEALIEDATSFVDLEARLRAGNVEIVGSDGLPYKTEQLMDITQDIARHGAEMLKYATSKKGFRAKLQELLNARERQESLDREGAGAELVEGATSLLEVVLMLRDNKLEIKKGDGSLYDSEQVANNLVQLEKFGLERIGTIPRAMGLRKKAAELYKQDRRQGR